MPTVSQDILARLRSLKPELASRFKAREIGLFGSSVRGELTDASDIDVLVDFEEGADLFDLVGMALFLEEELRRRVDLVPRRALRAELKESVLSELVLV